MQLLPPGSTSQRPMLVGNARRTVLADGRIELIVEGKNERSEPAAPITLILTVTQARQLARGLFHSVESVGC